MASPTPTLPNDSKEDQDSRYEPVRLKELKDAELAAAASAGIDQEMFANDPKNSSQNVRDKEENPEAGIGGLYEPSVGGKNTRNARINVRGFLKKRGPLGLIIGLLGIGGGLGVATFGPFSSLINLGDNALLRNDSSSVVMERRLLKVFSNTSADNPLCQNVARIQCRAGKMPNSALNQLARKGVIGLDSSGNLANDGRRTGYPRANPSNYEIDLGNGQKKIIPASQLNAFLADNPRIASKVLGPAGAFNMRVKVWSSNQLAKTLYKRFGIKLNGGLADGTNVGGDAKTRLANIFQKLRSNLPKLDTRGVSGKVADRMRSNANAAKKGGVGYTVAVTGCIAVKAPGYIAGGVAALQLAQLLPIAMDVILSPSSKLKASGVDPAAGGLTGEDVDAINSMLTNKTPRESDGKLTSALDSAILLAAIGVNKNAPAVSQKYTPGLSILTNPLVRSSLEADRATEDSCNVIMSPAAMYSAVAVDAAVTAAASTTIIGGVVKIVGSFLVAELVSAGVQEVGRIAAEGAIQSLAENDTLLTAEGEEFGDVLGLSLMGFFASGSMSANIPTLTTGQQLAEFAAIKNESFEMERQMHIATLSPLDTSSRYTFLGSMVYALQTQALARGVQEQNIFSTIGTILSVPFAQLSPIASANPNFDEAYCGYADEFGLGVPEGKAAPAINAAGLPCTGFTEDQINMSTSEAISLMISEGWLDETIDLPEQATTFDLVDSGYIRANTPLYDYITSCSAAAQTGDYIFNAASCAIESQTADPSVVDNTLSEQDTCSVNASGDRVCPTGLEDYSTGTIPDGVKNARSMVAIPVFLTDFQILEILREGVNDVEEE